MGNIIGIDLGTTNSVAAFKFAEVEVVTAGDNSPPDRKLTKSVVALNNETFIVGEVAYNRLKSDAKNTIVSVKRLMGRGFSDETVQKQIERLGYKITKSNNGTENSLSVWLDDKEFEPEDISAAILKKIVFNAQKYQENQGKKSAITHAVITIPAYFNDKQRYATENAAFRSGLAKPELLPEPTAAAISYGFNPNDSDVKTILVYDFGGGTFDACIITASGDHFIELSKEGDLWLGGDDIDHRLMELVLNKVSIQEDIENIQVLIDQMPHHHRVNFLGDLKVAVEKAKIELSSCHRAAVISSIPLLDEMGLAVDINTEITRSEFNPLILPLVERTIAICQQAIRDAEYPLEMIDIILLVGGSAQIPLVQEKVREAFGSERVIVHPNPMYAVAEGAAIVSAGLIQKTGTVSRNYCIKLVDEPRYLLIKKDDILPIKKSFTFRTEADEQRIIQFEFFSPDEVRNEDESIGEMWLALDKPYPKGTEIFLTAELDEKNSALQLTAVLKNDSSIRISCSFSRGKQDENISRNVSSIIAELNERGTLTQYGVKQASEIAARTINATNQMIDEGGEIRIDRQQIAQLALAELNTLASEKINGAKNYIDYFNFALNVGGGYTSESQRQRIKNLVTQLELVINNNNYSKIDKLHDEAKQEFENLPEIIHLLIFCRDGLNIANTINPSEANIINTKFRGVLNNIERGNLLEVEKLLREVLILVSPYFDQEMSSGKIAKGLTK
jgi:molecular chaperone DnaK